MDPNEANTSDPRRTFPEQNRYDPYEVRKRAEERGEVADHEALSASETAHVRHVLTKHFFHDKPDAAIVPGSAGYCPHCDNPVTATHTDGTAICSNGHRFPVQSARLR